MPVVVYDLETTGTNAECDRIAQFAAVTVSDDLETVLDEHDFLVAPDPGAVPNPIALLVGRLTPQRLAEDGVSEWEASNRIRDVFSAPGTVRTGWNSVGFDDEFTRYLMWRNLHDPYRAEWDGGNSRVDGQTLYRAASVLTPSMAQWPVKEDGKPTYKLGHMMEALGLEFEGRAHDAAADAKGTLDLLRTLREKAPRVWEHGNECADKWTVGGIMKSGNMIMHVSPFYGNERRCAAPITYIADHPKYNGRSIHVDIGAATPPDMLGDMSAEDIREALFAKGEGEGDDDEDAPPRPPLCAVAHNSSPFVLDLEQLEKKSPGSLAKFVERTSGGTGVDVEEVIRRRRWVSAHSEMLREKAEKVFEPPEHEAREDAEMDLYGGFVTRDDRQICRSIQRSLRKGEGDLRSMVARIKDGRVKTLAARLAAKHAPDRAGGEAVESLDKHVASCLANGLGPRHSVEQYKDLVRDIARDAEPGDGDLVKALASARFAPPDRGARRGIAR